MDYTDQYEIYLRQQLLLCQNRYAFCQELASQVTSEMTELQQKENKLESDLARLCEARELYQQRPETSPVTDNQYYTSRLPPLQEEDLFLLESESRDRGCLVRHAEAVVSQGLLWPMPE